MTNRKTKRVISGLLAIVTILSALIQPAMAFAEEPAAAAYEAEYPALETVRQELAEDGGLLLYSMDTRMSARMMARSVSGGASLVTGQEVFYPTNLGNYSTNIFTVNGRIAYCLESAKGTPATGSYASYVLESRTSRKRFTMDMEAQAI